VPGRVIGAAWEDLFRNWKLPKCGFRKAQFASVFAPCGWLYSHLCPRAVCSWGIVPTSKSSVSLPRESDQGLTGRRSAYPRGARKQERNSHNGDLPSGARVAQSQLRDPQAPRRGPWSSLLAHTHAGRDLRAGRGQAELAARRLLRRHLSETSSTTARCASGRARAAAGPRTRRHSGAKAPSM